MSRDKLLERLKRQHSELSRMLSDLTDDWLDAEDYSRDYRTAMKKQYDHGVLVRRSIKDRIKEIEA